MEAQTAALAAAGYPIISVDTKKKALMGDFKNAGPTWCQRPIEVNVHDFPSDALGRAVPDGISDVQRKVGAVYVGASADTPEFAVMAIAHWWEDIGASADPQARPLVILADAGGSQGCRPRLWTAQLQRQRCDRLGLSVTGCHYPTGCSKWNPIEPRLVSHRSRNWAGQPVRTLETMLRYVRGTNDRDRPAGHGQPDRGRIRTRQTGRRRRHENTAGGTCRGLPPMELYDSPRLAGSARNLSASLRSGS